MLVNDMYMMTVLYTHYVVDYTAALAMAGLITKYGEYLIFLYDVKLIGTRINKRGPSTHSRNCSGCGWPNLHAARYTDDKEI